VGGCFGDDAIGRSIQLDKAERVAGFHFGADFLETWAVAVGEGCGASYGPVPRALKTRRGKRLGSARAILLRRSGLKSDGRRKGKCRRHGDRRLHTGAGGRRMRVATLVGCCMSSLHQGWGLAAGNAGNVDVCRHQGRLRSLFRHDPNSVRSGGVRHTAFRFADASEKTRETVSRKRTDKGEMG